MEALAAPITPRVPLQPGQHPYPPKPLKRSVGPRVAGCGPGQDPSTKHTAKCTSVTKEEQS